MIRIKTPSEIEKMKKAGKAVAVALREVERVIVPGKTAWDVEILVLEIFKNSESSRLSRDTVVTSTQRVFP